MSIYAIMQEIYIFRFQHCLKDSIQMKDFGLKKIEFKVLIKCTFVVTKFHDKDVILQWLGGQDLLPVEARLFLINILKNVWDNINRIRVANTAFVNLTKKFCPKSCHHLYAFLSLLGFWFGTNVTFHLVTKDLFKFNKRFSFTKELFSTETVYILNVSSKYHFQTHPHVKDKAVHWNVNSSGEKLLN